MIGNGAAKLLAKALENPGQKLDQYTKGLTPFKLLRWWTSLSALARSPSTRP